MTMRVLDRDKPVESHEEFVDRVRELSGEDVRRCNQCGKCLAGCPLAGEMDLTPSQVMRATQAGLRDLALDSRAIWCCAGCETCAARCPLGLDLCQVMKTLTALAYAEGRTRAAPDIVAFHQSFVDVVGTLGRNYELGLVGLMKVRTRNLFQDIPLGMKLFARGKLNLIPERIRARAQVARLVREGLARLRRPRPGGPGAGAQEEAS